MEAWIGSVVGSVVAAAGFFLTWLVQRRAARTQEKQADIEESSSLVSQWQAWAEEQKQARVETEQKVRQLDERVHEARREVEDLRMQFRRLEGRLMAAVDFIKRMLSWAADATHQVPHPSLPDDIADLINTKPGGTA